MKKLLFSVVALLFVLSSCTKTDDPYAGYDAVKQLAQDEIIIKDYIQKNTLTNVKRDTTGVYYEIIEPGDEKPTYTGTTSVKAKYAGRLLGSSTTFDANTATFPLGGVIPGWQIGVQKIGPGGKIRLIIPSPWAYGPQATGVIPANSILDFDIELLEVVNSN